MGISDHELQRIDWALATAFLAAALFALWKICWTHDSALSCCHERPGTGRRAYSSLSAYTGSLVVCGFLLRSAWTFVRADSPHPASGHVVADYVFNRTILMCHWVAFGLLVVDIATVWTTTQGLDPTALRRAYAAVGGVLFVVQVFACIDIAVVRDTISSQQNAVEAFEAISFAVSCLLLSGSFLWYGLQFRAFVRSLTGPLSAPQRRGVTSLHRVLVISGVCSVLFAMRFVAALLSTLHACAHVISWDLLHYPATLVLFYSVPELVSGVLILTIMRTETGPNANANPNARAKPIAPQPLDSGPIAADDGSGSGSGSQPYFDFSDIPDPVLPPARAPPMPAARYAVAGPAAAALPNSPTEAFEKLLDGRHAMLRSDEPVGPQSLSPRGPVFAPPRPPVVSSPAYPQRG